MAARLGQRMSAQGRFGVLPSAESLAGKQRTAVAALAHHRFG